MRKHLPDFLPRNWTCQAYVWRRLLYFFRVTNWVQAKSLRALGQSGNSNGRRLAWGWIVGKTVAALQGSTARVSPISPSSCIERAAHSSQCATLFCMWAVGF